MFDLGSIQKILNSTIIKIIIRFLIVFLLLDFGIFILTSKNFTNKLQSNGIHFSQGQISKKAIDDIDSAVSKYDLIIGIQITQVDFQKNVRHILYTSIDDKDLEKIYNEFLKDSIGDVPLFNGDAENDERLARIINGEFVCRPFPKTLPGRLMPSASKYVDTVCAVSIPPSYGRIVGIVTVYIKRTPTEIELDQIRYLSQNLADLVYKDINSINIR